ncbi:hypothetical protein QCA50_009841 [Cerrena zonata]|uniref:RING-type E3 ubiquitin transferase n=1 Tax=Cerrena zonata TaxID=2478898 RepID=A0AAW0G851_9APHY
MNVNPPNNQDDQLRDTEANLPPRRPRSSIPSILFITFVLFMLTNNRTEDVLTRTHYLEALDVMNLEMGNYSAWINGNETSNFTLPSLNPNEMPLVTSLLTFGSQLDPSEASYYTNLTGFWRGEVQFYNLTSNSSSEANTTDSLPWQPIAHSLLTSSNFTTNVTELEERLGSWNWSASNKAAISVGDKLVWSKPHMTNVSKDIAIIHGKIDLTDPKSSDELRIDFDGVHFISNGSIYAFASTGGSRYHPDLRYVPYLVPEHRRNETAKVIEVEEYHRISKNKEKVEAGTLDPDQDEDDDSPKTICSFDFFAQLSPSTVPQFELDELEQEIDKPTGVSTIDQPPLLLNAVLVSADCGMMYEMKDLRGLKSQSLYRKITTYAGLSGIINAILLILLTRQTSRSHSAVGLGRVSRYPFLAQSLIDAVSFVGHLTLAILAEGRPSLAVLAPAGMSCILFVREAQFSVLIGQIQAPEDSETARPTPQPTAPSPPVPATNTSTTPTQEDTDDPHNEDDDSEHARLMPPTTSVPPITVSPPTPAPLPAPAPAPGPPPHEQGFLRFLLYHIRTDPSARLWTIMSFFLIVVFRLVIVLSLPLLFIASLYAFMWFPQIQRSIKRGRTSGMSAEYLIGATLCRLYFLLYFMACPKNILDVEPRPWVWFVVLFIFLQVAVLLLQDRFGPRFFLPSQMAKPTGYDYHPPIPLPDPEAPEQSLGDCAICMDAIEVDASLRQRSGADDEKGNGGFSRSGALWAQASVRKSYSLAPCHHLFHTACLERWLAIKNICPQCRRPLPPL